MGLRGSRKKDKKSTGWFKDVVLGMYTSDMVRDDWAKIGPAERIKVAAQWVPKEMKVESDTTISLIINGIRQVKAIDNTVHDALPVHEDDDV